ncbi:MAG: hypothetical protein EOO08_13160 [Chitinophagaceae bacterium]|nr:MAG: hypothetical protein EOO08_13160 [Chitinophagaceae bacterium]
MLNFGLKGTYQDPQGFNWDYYRDDETSKDPNAFYIVPRPQFVINAQGVPQIGILTYQTDDATNGAGICHFDVELSVPPEIQAAVAQGIKNNPQLFPGVGTPYFLTLPWNAGSSAGFFLNTKDGDIWMSAPASDFGSNVASFQLHVTKEQADTLKTLFAQKGGSINVEYKLSVPARLRGVSATLSFDSSIAFQYQVTQARYNSWGDESSPRTVQTMLQESQSSKVTLDWGVANPPDDMRKAVAGWANSTIADLVNAEVKKVVAIQGQTSWDSFSINEVSSFTSTYAENMVIAWIISPSATLPSLADLGLDTGKFFTTVNEQKQQMVVVTNLPFESDSKTATNVPMYAPGNSNDMVAALVRSVEIAVKYPTLSEEQSSGTFSTNGTLTFLADYDTNAGMLWDLEYTVNYTDVTAPTVNGTIKGIGMGRYVLKVDEAGILTVTFDATQAFASTTPPKSIDVNLSYINPDPTAQRPLVQTLHIDPTTPQPLKVTSLQALPINMGYNFQLQYNYPSGVVYKAPVYQNQTGAHQLIPDPNAMAALTVFVFSKADVASDDPLFGATVNLWYEGPVKTPEGFSGSYPTKQSPAVFSLTPDTDKSGNIYGKQIFYGLKFADQPLHYTATIDSASGEIDISDQRVDNMQPSILINPTQRYFTLEVNPSAIDWTKNLYDSVQVLVTATVVNGATPKPYPQHPFTWNNGESGSKFYTLSIQDGNTVSYDVVIKYIKTGMPTKSVPLTALKDVVLDIPATHDTPMARRKVLAS